MKGFKLSIRNTIILFNAILISITGAVILTIYASGSNESIYKLTESLMREISRSAVNKTTDFLSPAERANYDLALHFYSRSFGDFRDNQSLVLDYLKTMLKANPEFSMAYFADTKGNLVMQRRMIDGSFSKRLVYNYGNQIEIKWEHENPGYFVDFANSTTPADKGYDPRKRVWYKLAQEKKGMAWTDVYPFATGKTPGFSNVLPVYDENGKLYGVCSIDIGVLDLSYFLKSLSITPNAKTIFIDSNKNLLGLPLSEREGGDSLVISDPKEPTKTPDLRPIDKIPDPIYALAYDTYQKLKSPDKPFQFSSNGQSWLGMFQAIPSQRGINLVFGVLIPDDDLTGVVRQNQLIIFWICIGMVVVAVLLSLILSNAISHPLKQLSVQMNLVKDFVLESGANIGTIINEIDDMNSAFESMKRGLRNFRRYVPADLVAQLVRSQKEASVGGERKTLTIFFSDIENFTGISENLSPERLVVDLTEYFTELSKIINANEGTIDKYIGDAVMSFWGAPEELPDHAVLACRTALQIQKALDELNLVWENKGKSRFNTRIGLNTGDVIVGNMGSEERLNYTVIGDSVNVASRIEGLNKYYGTRILVSESTWIKAADQFEFRKIDKVAVKGKHDSFLIYELIAEKDHVSPERRKIIDLYEASLEQYFARDFAAARVGFHKVLKVRQHDGAAATLFRRCEAYLAKSPEAGWDGTFKLLSK